MLLPPLTNRLLTAADLVRQDAFLADIGTDHGYLPAYLVLSGRVSHAVAADVNPGPLSRAALTIQKYGLSEKIDLLLSDGLDKIDPSVQDIVIAGMGGGLIADILFRAEWTKDPAKRLILQPMTQDAFLRRFLAQNGYMVLEETVAEEGRHLYILLLAAYSGEPRRLTELEAVSGGRALKSGVLSRKYLCKKRDTLLKIAEGLLRSGNQTEAEQKRTLASLLEQQLAADWTKNQEGE